MKLRCITILLFISYITYSQNISSKDYIEQYKEMAIQEMVRTGVPASITIAQGMLESGNGNSRLAKKANNHFGIKCHNWQGATIYHDDDRKGECFRKYKSVHESYIDHSDFLTNTSRYDKLFELKSTDYKGWARGLKKAGYATSPGYDHKLIRIIETYELYNYDISGKNKPSRETDFPPEISITGREIRTNNNVKYVVAKAGDTYASLTNELDLMKWQLAKYNEITPETPVRAGDFIYLQPKRSKAPAGHKSHIVQEGETMHDISQKYGIKKSKLYEKNLMEEGSEPVKGDVLWLRRGKKDTDSKVEPKNNRKIFNFKKQKRKKQDDKSNEIPDNQQQELEFIFE